MDYVYDGQIARYLTQFMRVVSNFSYMDARGQLVQVPVRYGDLNRQVGNILKKNTENTIPSAPFFACYIKNLEYDRSRLQEPTYVNKMQIRERQYDDQGNEYLNTQGSNYTLERIMPSPYKITFALDIWSTNTQQKLQLWEQLAMLFNPSMELQTTDNYVDWTSLTVLEMTTQTWSSRQVPQGLEQDIDIVNLTFTSPIWISPPAKVKQMGIITKIIANVFAVSQNAIQNDFSTPDAVEMFGVPDATVVVTPGNFELFVIDNAASLIINTSQGDNLDVSNGHNSTSWYRILDLYPGKFRAGLSQLRLAKPNGGEIVAYMSLNPFDETKMMLSFNPDTIPGNTILADRGTVDAIIDPETFNPQNPVSGIRYLILEDINMNETVQPYDGPRAWKNLDGSDFQASANDIIQWDGSKWNIIFDSTTETDVIYITNSYTGVQYKWQEGSWSKSFEKIYDRMSWRLIL
jgi:hypothetical protein